MKRLFLALLLLALPVRPSPQPGQPPRPLVFTHVTVIDATGASAQTDMTVVITGDRITEIGRSASVEIPKDAQVIDATGRFLIPGLWDMHVHGYHQDYLPLYIANGVTGTRVMSGDPLHHQWRHEIEQGTLRGPRMAIASMFVDGQPPVWPGSYMVKDAAEGRQAVSQVKQEHADFIKVYDRLPREAYLAVADEAKKQGISFAGHVPYAVSVIEASEAGQKSIEHLSGLLDACSTREDEIRKRRAEARSQMARWQRHPSRDLVRPLNRLMLDTFSPEKAKEVAAHLVRNRTWQCPTLTMLRNMAFVPSRIPRSTRTRASSTCRPRSAPCGLPRVPI